MSEKEASIRTPSVSSVSMGNLGIFEDETDVGDPALKGRTEFDAACGVYRVAGAGVNIWGARDEFHFVWRQLSGDMILTATLRFEGAGAAAHRKAGLMIRRGLQPDSPYVDAVVHGDGLTGLQFRAAPGDNTYGVRFPVVMPTRIRLGRRGNSFGLWAGQAGEPLQEYGSIQIPLGNLVYAGLAVCSHLANVVETVAFSDVAIEALPPAAKQAK